MKTDGTHSHRRRLPRRRTIAFSLLLAGAASLTSASAATLRVTATGTDNVAAGSANVTACTTSMQARISGYSYGPVSGFTASSVTVTGIAGCGDRPIVVDVAAQTDGTTVILSESSTVSLGADGSTTVTIPGLSDIDPVEIQAVQVVIS